MGEQDWVIRLAAARRWPLVTGIEAPFTLAQPAAPTLHSQVANDRVSSVGEHRGSALGRLSSTSLRGGEEPMSHSRHSDPAERSALMRLFYRNWRPTSLGRWVNRFSGWWSGIGLPPKFMAVLEVRGRKSGRRRSNQW